MAGIKDTASSHPSAVRHSKTRIQPHSKKQPKIKPTHKRGRQFFRFSEAEGKTVEFVEMYTGQEFPCVEIGFTDKTALLVLMDTRLTMEPAYSNWKTGDQRLLRRWPVECR